MRNPYHKLVVAFINCEIVRPVGNRTDRRLLGGKKFDYFTLATRLVFLFLFFSFFS